MFCKRILFKCRHGFNKQFLTCDRSNFSTRPNIAIVGSGPAGFYTAQQILKGHTDAVVDIYERLPVPFGLVRFGVAPDHPEVKNVINTFTQTAKKERCSFIGNVCIGTDVSLKQLQDNYTAVVLAYGADDDKVFGIPGENLKGVLSARNFVGWYNGLPEDQDLRVNLDTDTAVVFGHGNVAIDVARMLLTTVDILKQTDITDCALEALSRSRVERVILIGRRGPLQVAFTTAELREMTRLPGAKPVFNVADFQEIKDVSKDIPRKRRRLTELLVKTAFHDSKEEDLKRWEKADKEWHLKFLRSPLEFLPSQNDNKILGAVKLGINTLETKDGEQPKAVSTGQTEELACGLVFRSIGYRSLPFEEYMPFDEYRAIVPNTDGRVMNTKGLYCSGWVKRGPVGVIASTMTDAFETGKVLCHDLESGELPITHDIKGKEAILKILKEKGIKPVTFSEWEKIDQQELADGESMGRPRNKITNIDKLLNVALSSL